MEYDENTMDLDEIAFELEKQIIDTSKYINMIKSDLEEDIHILENEIVKLKSSKEVAEKEQKSSRWKPKDGEQYWYINSTGSINFDRWHHNYADIWRYNNIPIFQTKEECEQYNKFREDVKTRSYEFSEEEWEDEIINKFAFYYNYEFGKFMVCSDSKYKNFNQIYFKTKEDVQYIIDTYPEELKKWRV